MSKKIVAGNWKMNLLKKEAFELHSSIESELKNRKLGCEVYHFVPFLYLEQLGNKQDLIYVGAQNGYPENKGAFTGEVSFSQLSSVAINSVLIGHSERRQLFNESNTFLRQKVDAAIANGFTLFFCCGESLQQREAGTHEHFVAQQLKESLFHLSESNLKNVVIAYEPIWAIGTGKTATPEQANSMHKYIRNEIANHYSLATASATSILYGGSCKPSNAKTLFEQSDIDGGLIGGASLNSADFIEIISNFCD